MSAYIQQTAATASDFAKFALLQVLLATASNLINGFSTIPLTLSNAAHGVRHRFEAAYLCILMLIAPLYGVAIGFALTGGGGDTSLMLALTALVFLYTARWVLRGFHLAAGVRTAPALSDYLYLFIIFTSILMLSYFRRLSFLEIIEIYTLAIAVSTLPYFKRLVACFWTASDGLGGFRQMLKERALWSLGTVIATDLGSNSHTYAINAVLGNGAFAPVALGVMMLRPIGIIQTAFMQIDGFTLTQLASARNWPDLRRALVRQIVSMAVLFAAYLVVCFAVLDFFPERILRGQYAHQDVTASILLLAAILASKIVREPLTMVLQQIQGTRHVATLTALFSASSVVGIAIVLLRPGATATDPLLISALSEAVFSSVVIALLSRVRVKSLSTT